MNIEVKTTHTFTPEDVSDIFVGFVEGNYMSRQWVTGGIFDKKIGPAEFTADGTRVVWYGRRESFEISDWEVEVHYDDPTSENGEGNNEGRFTMTPAAFALGLETMALTHAEHYSDLINENADIITYDILLQLIVLKEVIYG